MMRAIFRVLLGFLPFLGLAGWGCWNDNASPQIMTHAENALCQPHNDGYAEFSQCVRSLEDSRNLPALRALSRSGHSHSYLATGAVARLVDSGEVIAFCSTFEPGSTHWRSAFGALATRPKVVVLNYLVSLSSSPDPLVRFCCYELCFDRGWDDLLKNATDDVYDPSVIWEANMDPAEDPFDQTLGKMATRYVNRITSSPEKMRNGVGSLR